MAVRGDEVVDLTRRYPTTSHLLNVATPAEVRAAIKAAPRLATLEALAGRVAEQLRGRGMPLIEAAVEAARIRLRPILMTSFAFILGVVPLMVAHGA